MKLNRAARKYVDIPVQVKLRNGKVVSVATIDVAILAPGTSPVLSTVWTTVPVTANRATILLLGPEAVVVPGGFMIPLAGADVWIRIIDAVEIDPVKVEHVSVS